MKDPRNYISLAFAKYDPLRLAGFAENIGTKMALLAFFTTPDPPLADVLAAAKDLRLKQEARTQGGTQATGQRDDAFDVLENLLRELAAYVEDKAKNDRDLMLSTGFEVTTASHSSPTIVVPGILDIQNPASGKLLFKIESCGARATEIWGRTGTDDFKHFLTLTDPRAGVVDNLVPGALYDWKVRALFPNNTYSDWSDVISHRST
jgi:hypothetical protein